LPLFCYGNATARLSHLGLQDRNSALSPNEPRPISLCLYLPVPISACLSLSLLSLKRFGEPEELIGALLLLASSKGGQFITGTHVNVDGGFTAAWF
jgi:NAD(P)-dependent dehydrogenase (short-subunit alcohol dehydrogenase family)